MSAAVPPVVLTGVPSHITPAQLAAAATALGLDPESVAELNADHIGVTARLRTVDGRSITVTVPVYIAATPSGIDR